MRRYDHRSPVQPGSSKGWLFAAGAALAVMVWGIAQQAPRYPEKRSPASEREQPQSAEPSRSSGQSLPSPSPDTENGSRAMANLASLFSEDDYPTQAIRNNEQGTVGFRLVVDTTGRAASCTIARFSGYRSLDDATCRIVTARLRARPARDTNGNPIADTMSSRVKWVLPED